MESLRLLGKQQEFEDTSIDYCVTFEVSPPSWEPMPDWIRAEAAAPADAELLGPVDVGEGESRMVVRVPRAQGPALSRALDEGPRGDPSRGQKCSSPSKCDLQVGQMSKAVEG